MANTPALVVRWLVFGSRARRNIPANLIFLSIHTSFLSVYNSQWWIQGRGPGAPVPPLSQGLDDCLPPTLYLKV